MNDREIEDLIVALEAHEHFSVALALTQLRDERNALRAKLVAERRCRTMTTEAGDKCCGCPPDNGATLLLAEDFAGEQMTNEHLTYWTSTPEAYVGCVTPFTTWQGSTCGYYLAQKGTNEKTPWQVSVETDDAPDVVGAETFAELCLEWKEWFVSGYPWAHGQKMLRVMYENGNYPDSKKSFGWSCLNNNGNLQAECYIGLWGSTEYGSIEWFENTGQAHPEDAWVTWRVWLKLNTPGESDGFVRITRDGNPVVTAEELNLRGTDPRGFNAWWLGGNYSTSGGAHVLPCDGDRYVTGIRWWDTAP